MTVTTEKRIRAVVTDIDGTLTDEERRLSTAAIETIRALEAGGVQVILASGNTSCILKGLSKLIGTSGTFIGENGGVYRIGYNGRLQVLADRQCALDALAVLTEYYEKQGIVLDLYSPLERYADVAFARTVPVDEVRKLLKSRPVAVLDTGFAIHIQQNGIGKGMTFLKVAEELGIAPVDFLAIGDSDNDADLIGEAGIGCGVGNASLSVREKAIYISEKPYGEGFVSVIERFLPYLASRRSDLALAAGSLKAIK